MSEDIIDVEGTVEPEQHLITWMMCPTVGCGWQWAVAVTKEEPHTLASWEIPYCVYCSTDEQKVMGILIPPDEKDHIEYVASTSEPTAEEAAVLRDLLLMLGRRSPDLKLHRFRFAGQPAGVLYEHINAEGTFGRIRPLAVLLTPTLLKALRPPRDWAIQPASITLIDQKGEDDDDNPGETDPSKAAG